MSSKTQTTPALLATTRNSLFDIELGWIPLLEARVEAETSIDLSDDRPVCLMCGGIGARVRPPLPDADSLNGTTEPCQVCEGTGRSKSPRELAIEAADLALAEHSEKELEKADSYIGLIRYLERAAAARRLDAQHQGRIAGILEAMLAQVKATAVNAMGVIGRKRIEGSRGYLLAKKNGSLAPLLIPDDSQVPDEFCKFEGWVNAGVWTRMVEICRRHMMVANWEPNARWTARVPDKTAIRAKLGEPCARCIGDGTVAVTSDTGGKCVITCPECGGSKTAGVPGASIGERGVHLEVK